MEYPNQALKQQPDDRPCLANAQTSIRHAAIILPDDRSGIRDARSFIVAALSFTVDVQPCVNPAQIIKREC